jgi:hypothetical protein
VTIKKRVFFEPIPGVICYGVVIKKWYGWKVIYRFPWERNNMFNDNKVYSGVFLEDDLFYERPKGKRKPKLL